MTTSVRRQTNDIVVVEHGDAAGVLTQPPAGVRVASASYRGPYESHGTDGAELRGRGRHARRRSRDVLRSGLSIRYARQRRPRSPVCPSKRSGCSITPARTRTAAAATPMRRKRRRSCRRKLGKPVRLQLSRQDEFGWDNYGPAHLAEMRGAVDANGKIVAFEYQAWGHDGNGVGTALPITGDRRPECRRPRIWRPGPAARRR